jgi:hypothetical protein
LRVPGRALRYAVECIQAPTLVISLADRFGTDEGARYTAERIPRVRFIGCASGGHVWWVTTMKWRVEIVAFLHVTVSLNRQPPLSGVSTRWLD